MLLKGTQIGITGEISLRPYTTKDGVEKTSLECRVSDVTLLGGKQDGATKQKVAVDVVDSFDDVESDIPF